MNVSLNYATDVLKSCKWMLQTESKLALFGSCQLTVVSCVILASAFSFLDLLVSSFSFWRSMFSFALFSWTVSSSLLLAASSFFNFPISASYSGHSADQLTSNLLIRLIIPSYHSFFALQEHFSLLQDLSLVCPSPVSKWEMQKKINGLGRKQCFIGLTISFFSFAIFCTCFSLESTKWLSSWIAIMSCSRLFFKGSTTSSAALHLPS